MPMKFSEFLSTNEQLLKEELNGVFVVQTPERTDNDAFELYQIEKPEVLLRLNNALSQLSNTTHTNINWAINAAWRKLNASGGLTFHPIPKITEAEGKLVLPLTQFGGIFDALTGKNLDGVSHRMPDGKGAALKFEWKPVKDGPNWQVTAEVITGQKIEKEEEAPNTPDKVKVKDAKDKK